LPRNANPTTPPGHGGGSWFKFRLGHAQEFVVGGIKTGNPFEALLVGYYEGKQLIYAGKSKRGLHHTFGGCFTKHLHRSKPRNARLRIFHSRRPPLGRRPHDGKDDGMQLGQAQARRAGVLR